MTFKFANASLIVLSVALLTGCNGAADTPAETGSLQATVPPVELSKLPPEGAKSWAEPKAMVADGDLANRLTALEKSVQSLQQQFAEAKPTLEKMEAAERQFRALSLELDRISSTYGLVRPQVPAVPPVIAPHVMAKPIISPQDHVPKPVAKPKQVAKKPETAAAKPAPVAAGKVTVNAVRLGAQQNGKTRVVLDLSGPGQFSYDLDEQEKILVIELKNASAKDTLQKSGLASPIVQSYSVQNDGSDARIILQLKDGATVTGSDSLGPSSGAGHRVYVDLAKG